MSEHFCLPLQVNLCIDVSCIDGDMTEPGPDRVDIDSGAKKVSCRSMPDRVGADRSLHQFRVRGAATRMYLRSIQ